MYIISALIHGISRIWSSPEPLINQHPKKSNIQHEKMTINYHQQKRTAAVALDSLNNRELTSSPSPAPLFTFTAAKEAVKADLKEVIDPKELRKMHCMHLFQHFIATKHDMSIYSSQDVGAIVEHCTEKAESDDMDGPEKEKIRSAFTRLSTLDENHFPRKLYLGNRIKLQRILSQELEDLHNKEVHDPSLKENPNHLLAISVAKAKLAVDLGCREERAGGCNGAVIVKSLEGKAIGVFKAAQKEGFFSIFRTLKKYFGQARLFNRRDSSNEPYSEVAMHYFSQMFGFNIAPSATTAVLKGEEGSFLAFLDGYQELKDVRSQLEKRDHFDEEELVKWQTAVVAIFASLNFDPHDGNIFVALDTAGKIDRIKVIDAGNNFAEYLPSAIGPKGHRMEPGQLKISHIPFHEKVLEFIDKNLTEANLDKFVAQIKRDKPDFWSEEMNTLHKKTLLVLRNGVLTGKITTPKELLCVITQEGYKKFVSDDWSLLDVGNNEARIVLDA